MPSGITADYSADFFAALNEDVDRMGSGSGSSTSRGTVSHELDRGNEEIVAALNTTIENQQQNGNGNKIGSIGGFTTRSNPETVSPYKRSLLGDLSAIKARHNGLGIALLTN